MVKQKRISKNLYYHDTKIYTSFSRKPQKLNLFLKELLSLPADVTSFDGGYGSAYLAKMVGQKKAREIFFLGRNYNAQEAFDMGMVNAVVPHLELEATAYDWAQEILAKSPISIKMLKFAMNLTDDGMVGQQVFAGEATRLAYMTDEAKEGRNAFLEKRPPNFEKKWIP